MDKGITPPKVILSVYLPAGHTVHATGHAVASQLPHATEQAFRSGGAARSAACGSMETVRWVSMDLYRKLQTWRHDKQVHGSLLTLIVAGELHAPDYQGAPHAHNLEE